MKALLLAAALTLAAGGAAAQTGRPAGDTPANDYPTTARVDYVLGCMATNGQSWEVVQRCSCSIDTIAELIPYEDYVEVEAAMSVQNLPGERFGMIRDVDWIKDLLERFRLAQVEADLRCFPRGGSVLPAPTEMPPGEAAPDAPQ